MINGIPHRYPLIKCALVGGTSGIGLYTVREFARYTVSPTVYLVGRNEAQAKQVIQELSLINPHGKFQFIKTDASLLCGVDSACEVIQRRESRINLLFLSCGIFTMKGRDGMFFSLPISRDHETRFQPAFWVEPDT